MMKGSVNLLLVCSLAALCGCNHIGPLHGFTSESSSMEPTIRKGDKVLADYSYFANRPIRDGDVIIFRHGEFTLVKRVTALGGETIEGKDGVFFRNAQKLDEPYVRHSDIPRPELHNFASRVVPQGEVFVTGDNRDESLDSRVPEFGIVKVSDVLGVADSIQSSFGSSRRSLIPAGR